MDKLKQFIITTLLGGITVILPVVLLAAVFNWLFNFVTRLIQPLTDIIVARTELREIIADVLVILIILAICFGVGILVRTRFGKFLHNLIEQKLFKAAPGYSLIKETILQILGNKEPPFSKVVLVQIFENDTMVTGFVTDRHSGGLCSIFVPTGPNPTSGVIYHVESKYVHPVDVSVEDAMRSIISCGAGSSKLIESYKSRLKS